MIVDVIVSVSGFLGFHSKLSILDSLLKNKTSRQKAAAFIPPPEGGGSSRGGFITAYLKARSVSRNRFIVNAAAEKIAPRDATKIF
ncbi:hypothetical protein [Neomoorella thermoacetica]|uniref:hypothetical protein n=1 Tax=Neomoorella thermoacetica TaxID=1525 RepID=UPI0016532A37|nr:hypothetical protein [Moorella thermoacetica]